MAHTLDVKRLDEIFNTLLNNAHLRSNDRKWVERFAEKHEDGIKLSDRECEVLEDIWCRY